MTTLLLEEHCQKALGPSMLKTWASAPSMYLKVTFIVDVHDL